MGKLGLILILVVFPALAWADAVVLSSTAPGMSVGRVLADDEALRLPEETVTTLLLADGRMLKLRGPVEGRVETLGASGQVAVAAPAGGWGGMDLTALGGTRGQLAAIPPVPTDSVAVDVRQAGTWCLAGETKVTTANDGRLTDPRSGRSIELRAGQPWPRELPLSDGATYMAQGPSGQLPVRFRVLLGPPEDYAFRLAQAGCLAQVGPYLREVGARATPFTLYLSTDRGQAPRYAIGEKVTLVMQVNRPAHLGCALIRHGVASQLFPSGWIELADHQELRVPGDRMAVEVAATPPPGMGELRCNAVDASAQVDLPAVTAVGKLDVPEAQLASAHLFIRVQ